MIINREEYEINLLPVSIFKEYAQENNELIDYLFFWGYKKKNDNNIVGKECLSQMYPCHFEVDGRHYISAEQYMMSEKARLFKDAEIEEKIMNSSDPKEIQRLGRLVKSFDADVWDENKVLIVWRGNNAKFNANVELSLYLVSTMGRMLVEASPYDKIWGIGMKEDERGVKDPQNWTGENLLGFILMDIRSRMTVKK